jgi:polar amino acid transport system substrate-binding protein
VPPDIAAAGKLIVGTNVPYTPAEYRDTKGNIVGFDIDLLDAAAGELGLTTEFRASAFDQLIPAVNTGDTNVAASYLTDTREREQAVDMVTYHSGGSLWAQRPVARIDPNNACGLRVAVQATTTQETDELPAKSRACAAAGKPEIEILSFEGQDQATNAVVHGQADAMSADSAVTGYAVRISQGQIVAAGQIFDAAPVGWVVPKGSPLGPALRQALQRLIDSGRYMDILTKWGVEKGAITDSKINDATY